MSVSYVEGAKCILKHCHDLHKGETKCKRKFVRSTLLSIHTGGVTRVFSQINGPIKDFFECSNKIANCGCIHAEIKLINDVVATLKAEYVMQHILLCSYSPCTQCANAIIYCGLIDAVIYDRITPHDLRGKERLWRVLPTFTVRKIEEIASGSHREELCFIKRWSS